jgi:hypothetical protein
MGNSNSLLGRRLCLCQLEGHRKTSKWADSCLQCTLFSNSIHLPCNHFDPHTTIQPNRYNCDWFLCIPSYLLDRRYRGNIAWQWRILEPWCSSQSLLTKQYSFGSCSTPSQSLTAADWSSSQTALWPLGLFTFTSTRVWHWPLFVLLTHGLLS